MRMEPVMVAPRISRKFSCSYMEGRIRGMSLMSEIAFYNKRKDKSLVKGKDIKNIHLVVQLI